MDSRAFLRLEQSHNPFRWTLPVERHLCTSGAFLFGGCGLAAAIAALEGTSGRPLVWAACQYLSFAKPGEVLDIDVTVAVEGHQTTQARAVGRVGNREIITVNAALGDRPGMPSAQFEAMPDVEPPTTHRQHVHRRAGDGWINDQLEQRLVKGREVRERDGTPGDGQSLMWARIPDVIEGIDATALAILGDFDLAQDATQEAFVAAYFGLPGLRDQAKFAPWLRGIVRHQCHRFLRRRPEPALDEDATLARGDPIVVERVDGLTLTVRPAEEWEVSP